MRAKPAKRRRRKRLEIRPGRDRLSMVAPEAEDLYALTEGVTAKGTPYWSANFSRAGVQRQKRFYGPKHGGMDLAYAAALSWRNQMISTVPALSKLEFCQIPRSNTPAGIPGVVRCEPARQPDGIWQARLKIAGAPAKVASFSIRKHGEQRAFELAVQARRQMLDQVTDEHFLRDPTAKKLAPQIGLDDSGSG